MSPAPSTKAGSITTARVTSGSRTCSRDPAIQSIRSTLWCTAWNRHSAGTSCMARCVAYSMMSAVTSTARNCTTPGSDRNQDCRPALTDHENSDGTARTPMNRKMPMAR